MADFNKILTPGDVDGGVINVVVEIPTGSSHKIEWNRDLAVFQLDRVEPAIFAKPTNYGFIPQTLDEDGDELDALIITDEPLTTGVFLEAKVIGVMRMLDNNEADDKIIAVSAGDPSINHINDITELPPHFMSELRSFFEDYKKLENKRVVVEEFFDRKMATQILQDSLELYKKHFKQ